MIVSQVSESHRGLRALRGEFAECASVWRRSGLVALGAVCLLITSCGRAASTDPLPDLQLAMAIRDAAGPQGGSADSADPVAAAATTTWGSLKGVFRLAGPVPTPTPLNVNKDVQVCGKTKLVDESLLVSEEGGLSNVVLFVTSKSVPVHPSYADSAAEQVQIDNKDCHFVPHIVTLRVSQALSVHNSDTVAHNSNMTPLGDKAMNPNIALNTAALYLFKKAQRAPVPMICNIHPWMKGYVFPRDNPYMAVTAADGSFTIRDLPAGEWEFQVWHEKPSFFAAKPEWKKGKFKLTIVEGDNDLGTIEVAPELLQ